MRRALWIGVLGLAAAATGVWAMPGMGHRMAGASEGGCAMQAQGHEHGGMQRPKAMASMHGMGHGMGQGQGKGMHGGPMNDRSAAGCAMHDGHDGAGHTGCPMHEAPAKAPAKP